MTAKLRHPPTWPELQGSVLASVPDPRTGKHTEQRFRFTDVATKSLQPPKPSERLAAWILKLGRLPKPFSHWQRRASNESGAVLPFSVTPKQATRPSPIGVSTGRVDLPLSITEAPHATTA